MISYEQAIELLKSLGSLASSFKTEELGLKNCNGKILAQDLYAPFDSPRFHQSAMDGYAFSHNDMSLARSSDGIPCEGSLFAGEPSPPCRKQERSCLKIMTGSELPEWADTVAPVEICHPIANTSSVRINKNLSLGSNVRRKGEDIKQGSLLLRKGRLLDPERIMVCAQFGFSNLRVFIPPKIVLVTTGSELSSLDDPPKNAKIYDCSSYYLEAALARYYNLEPTIKLTLNDDPQKAFEILETIGADQENCLFISTGAVSAGDKDFIPDLINRLGFELIFHKVAIRPAKPTLLARRGSSLWMGLAGNPISTTVGFQFFVRPLLHFWGNYPFPSREKLSIMEDIEKPEGLTCFFRAQTGELGVKLTGNQGSARFLASLEADAYIVLSDSISKVNAGTIIDVQKF